jgi:hypothetical protein
VAQLLSASGISGSVGRTSQVGLAREGRVAARQNTSERRILRSALGARLYDAWGSDRSHHRRGCLGCDSEAVGVVAAGGSL